MNAAPLATRMRPEQLSDVVGQSHLLAEGKPLAVCAATRKRQSMILWGPPGVGKTTLAQILAKSFAAEYIAISAVFAGVKDIRSAVDAAQYYQSQGKASVLFIDEIHRFNKAQQDALLPFVESGLLTFIGATTENPSFEVNRALLSRAQVYVLKPLTEKDLRQLMARALQTELLNIRFDNCAQDALIHLADGDARRLLNSLEQVYDAATMLARHDLDVAFIENVLSKQGRQFDKGGDHFYDQISALHKSVRGSHPDAALYWFCRMLDGGVDPRYLARRIVRMAWEDIGLADPRALQIANDAASTYERLGSPEGELALAEAVIYLAIAAKSNAAYMAFKQAQDFVAKDKSQAVPEHLRNAPTKLLKDLGHGKHYRYAHDEPHAYAAGERYLPEGMSEPQWYQPVDRGLETKIAEKMAFLRALDAEKHG